MLPIVHGYENEYWGRVDFIYLNREDPANLAVVQQFGIVYQPVFILLDPQGNEIMRWFYFTEEDILPALDAAAAAY